MAENTPPTEAETKSKFQTWMNELLDARETAAAAAAKEAQDKAEKEAAERRTHEPLSMIRMFLGM